MLRINGGFDLDITNMISAGWVGQSVSKTVECHAIVERRFDQTGNFFFDKMTFTLALLNEVEC